MSRSVSRSVSRSLLRRDPIVTAPDSGVMKQLLDEQQKKIFELIDDHKKEIDTKLTSKSTRFQHKNIEKQFDINQEHKLLVRKAIEQLERKEKKKAKKTLRTLLTKIEEQVENLLIADRSSNGWLTVARLRNKDVLPSKILKEVEKIDSEIERSRNGRALKNAAKMDRKDGRGSYIQTSRPPKRKAPEEALKEAVNQTRTGACQHCEGDAHFYRECPKFWEKVIEARKQKE